MPAKHPASPSLPRVGDRVRTFSTWFSPGTHDVECVVAVVPNVQCTLYRLDGVGDAFYRRGHTINYVWRSAGEFSTTPAPKD